MRTYFPIQRDSSAKEETNYTPTLMPALRNSANFSTVLTFGPGKNQIHLLLIITYELADGGNNGGLRLVSFWGMNGGDQQTFRR